MGSAHAQAVHTSIYSIVSIYSYSSLADFSCQANSYRSTVSFSISMLGPILAIYVHFDRNIEYDVGVL